MENIKYRHLKFIPTGNVFKMPENDAVRILRSDRGNYKIVDKDFVDDDTADTAKTSTYEQVVVDNGEDKATGEMTKKELMTLCDELGIEYKKTAKKAELINLLALNEETAEE